MQKIRIPIRNSLSYRQTRNTVFVAFTIGLILSSAQIYLDYFSQQNEMRESVRHVLSTANRAAWHAAFNLDETGAYIQHRMQVAGMNPERVVFTPSVVQGVHKVTRGIPRVINVLCDRLLLGAYGRNKSRVDHAMLKIAAKEVLGEPYSFTPNG